MLRYFSDDNGNKVEVTDRHQNDNENKYKFINKLIQSLKKVELDYFILQKL